MVLWHLARIYFSYITARDTLEYPPLRMWVEPTAACNLSCIMCPNSELPEEKKGFMSMDLYRKIVSMAGDIGVEEFLLFNRGEPLLHRNIAEMVAMASERGIRTNIHTNGMLLDGNMARKLMDAGLGILSISFDAISPEVYRKIRTGGDYERVRNNIANAAKIREEKGYKTRITVESIIFPEYATIIGSEDDLKARVGIDGVEYRVRPLGIWASSKEGRERHITGKFRPCRMPWYSMAVLWDGTVVPCCQDWHGEMVMGDLRSQSIMEVWNSRAYREMRKNFHRGNYSQYPLCQRCPMAHIGMKGALGMALQYIMGRL